MTLKIHKLISKAITSSSPKINDNDAVFKVKLYGTTISLGEKDNSNEENKS